MEASGWHEMIYLIKRVDGQIRTDIETHATAADEGDAPPGLIWEISSTLVGRIKPRLSRDE